jgi:hypothetical protein
MKMELKQPQKYIILYSIVRVSNIAFEPRSDK